VIQEKLKMTEEWRTVYMMIVEYSTSFGSSIEMKFVKCETFSN